MIRQLRGLMDAYAVPGVLLLVTWTSLLAIPTNFGKGAFYPLFDSLALLGLVTVGVGVTMIAGELDLSAGSVAAVAGMAAVHAQPLGLVGAIAVATVAGIGFGALQGYLIVRLDINSLVLTIGTLIMVRGAAYLLGEQAILVDDPSAIAPLLGRFGPVPTTAVIPGAVIAVIALVLGFLKLGREIYAIGGDRAEAVAAGVRVGPAMVTAFAISAGCAALAGSLAAFQGGSAAPSSFDALLLLAVSAAIIGGVALSGGRGTIVNILFGVAILTSISAGMALRGQQAYMTQLATGGLLVLVILGEWVMRRIRERAKARALADVAVDGISATVRI